MYYTYFNPYNMNAQPLVINQEVVEGNVTKKRIIQILVDLTCIVIVFTAFIFVYSFAIPRKIGFFCNDTDIFKPFSQEILPFWAVTLYATIAPIIFIILSEMITFKLFDFSRKQQNAFKTDTNRRKMFLIATTHGLSLFVLGLGITLLLTDVAKKWIGRLRPHFIAVCNPDLALIECVNIIDSNTFFYNYVSTSDYNFCRGLDYELDKARQSFPSGHASYSTFAMLFLIIYLEARLHLLRLRFIKPLIQMTAFIAAILTSVSRVSDHHHRASDIIGGIVLGASVALFMTLIVGRVIWIYGRRPRYYDFDLIPMR
jgi:phosphatidate phosphatase